jgi:methylase of polypeptide subunit release factors
LLLLIPHIFQQKQYLQLDNSVKEYEPRIALDGGNDGLKYYKKLFKPNQRKASPFKIICILKLKKVSLIAQKN